MPRKHDKKLDRIPGGPLVARFTRPQAELAADICNDIAEGIDNGESRDTLRMVVAFYADLHCVASRRAAAAESRLKSIAIAKGIVDDALKDALK